MPVVIDPNLCIGCGACAALNPEIFRMDETSGQAAVVGPEAGENAAGAIESCSVQAISVK